MTSKPEITNVSDTALWVAHYRALETERTDALFHDPLAKGLVGERGKKIAERMKGFRYTSWSVVIRTCIIDDYIRTLLVQGVDTVLNLGAGLDTRPYRLDLPSSLRWIEVDYSHMIELKENQLRDEHPRCQLERIKLDLSDRDRRLELFSKISSESKKVLVLTEGVVPYLSNEQVAMLGTDLRNQAPFKFWIVDYFSPELLIYMQRGKLRRQLKNAPFQFFPHDWFRFFEQLGWKAKETRYQAEESQKLGRAIPMPWWFKLFQMLIPAKHAKPFLKFSGYVLLEPKP